MPKVTEEHREHQRLRIREATLAVIARKGLAATTMADIIAESGLSAGAIYGYHRSKDALILEIARRLMGERQDVLADMLARTPVPAPADALPELLRGLPHEWIADGVMLQFWGAASTQPELMTEVRALVEQQQASVQRYLQAWLGQQGSSDPAGRAAALTPAVAALAQGYILRGSLAPGSDHGDFFASISALIDGELARGAAGLSGPMPGRAASPRPAAAGR